MLRQRLDSLAERLPRAMREGLKARLDAAGIPYTINPKLVRGLDYYSKTAKGQPSTAEAVLAELAEQDFPLPKVLIIGKPSFSYRITPSCLGELRLNSSPAMAKASRSSATSLSRQPAR